MTDSKEKKKEKKVTKPIVEEVPDVIPEEEKSKAEETKEPEQSQKEEKEKKEKEQSTTEEESSEETEKETEVEEKPSRGKKIFLIVLFTAAIISVVVGGIIYYQTKVEKLTQLQPTATPVVLVTPEPTFESTPLPEIDLSQYSVMVSNGSGVAGEAGYVEDLLLTGGFEDISTGNAGKYDYGDTEVSIKKDVPAEVFASVKNALEDEYVVVKSDTLDEDFKYDIEIIVGEKK